MIDDINQYEHFFLELISNDEEKCFDHIIVEIILTAYAQYGYSPQYYVKSVVESPHTHK